MNATKKGFPEQKKTEQKLRIYVKNFVHLLNVI